MLQLTQPGEGTEDTRRRVRKHDLCYLVMTTSHRQAIEAVLEKLTAARLLTISRETDSDEEMVDVAHEALIRNWWQLRMWIEEDRDFLKTARQLTEAATGWDNAGREDSYLYRGSRLVQALELAETHRYQLNALEKEFLAAGEALARAAEQQKEAAQQRELDQAQALAEEQQHRAEIQIQTNARLRLLLLGLALGLLVAVGATFIAVQQRRLAQQQTEAAIGAQSLAETERERAEQQAQVALSRQLAAQATSLFKNQPGLALLLGLKASTIVTGDLDTVGAQPVLDLAYNPALKSMFHGHTELNGSVDFSPDGQTIISGDGNNMLFFWDARSGRPRFEPVRAHPDPVTAVTFSPNGQMAASASRDGTILTWNPKTGRTLTPSFTGHTVAVNDLTFSPDGTLLASAADDRTIRLWDPDTGRQIFPPLTGHDTGRSIVWPSARMEKPWLQ
jgi:hypothetical protein